MKNPWGWRESSAVEITDNFPEDPAKSQYPHGGSESSATPVSEDPTEFYDFTGILHT